MNKAKILVIEDDEFLRELIVQKLIKEEYEAFGAVDGKEGIKKIQEKKPDLILLDLIMPGINGFEVLQTIKNDPILFSIPVIILSNLGQKEEIQKGLRMGAKDFLVKAHFTPKEIVNKIKAVLKQNT